MSFSIPDAVKKEFDKAFGGQNKSAVNVELMRKAVADARRREHLFRRLTQRRALRPTVS